MRKKLSFILCFVLAIALGVSAITLASAAEPAFDGTTNLATDATLWNKGGFTTDSNCTIGANGIVFDEYGAGQACAGLALKEFLPYNNTIVIKFKGENAADAGQSFLKVVFADCSGSNNAAALKPWEISGKVEHLALEIKDTIQLWQYNEGNVYGEHKTQSLSAGNTNYMDNVEHTLTIDSAASETGVALKITVDDTVQYDGTIASTKLYCNSALTIGAYGTSLVSNSLTISSVTIKDNAPDQEVAKDESNLLYAADDWTVTSGENNEAVLDGEAGSLTVGNFGATAYGATYEKELPVAYKMTAKLEMTNNDTSATGDAVKGIRFVVLDNSNKLDGTPASSTEAINSVFVQVDIDGNVWVKTSKDGEEIGLGAGIWVPGLKTGVNTVSVTVKPNWTDYDTGVIEIIVEAGGTYMFKQITDLSLIKGNHLTIGGENKAGTNATFEVSSLKIEDLLTVPTPDPVTEDVEKWSTIDATVTDGVASLTGCNWAATADGMPASAEISTTVTLTADYQNWFKFGVSTYQSKQSNGGESATEGNATLTITLHTSYYLMAYYNGNNTAISVTHNSSTTTQLCGNGEHVFKFAIVGTDLKIWRDGTLDATIDISATAFATAEKLYIAAFTPDGSTSKGTATLDVSYTYTPEVDENTVASVEAMRDIYALPCVVTEENAREVKAAAEAVKAEIDLLDEAIEVNNYDYIAYVISLADAQIAVIEAKEAAAEVDDVLAQITVPEILNDEIVATLEAAVAAAKASYEALPEAAKGYIENYGKIEEVEIAVEEYKLAKADQAAAADVIALIDLIEIPEEINADNIGKLRIDVNAARVAYDGLTATQKALVTNYADLENAEIAVESYVEPPQSSDDPTSGSGSGSSDGEVTEGCFAGMATGSALFAVIALAGAVLLKKKRD